LETPNQLGVVNNVSLAPLMSSQIVALSARTKVQLARGDPNQLPRLLIEFTMLL